MNKALTILFIATAIMVFGNCSTDSGTDVSDIASALEDRLTDALDIEGGEVKDGEPPEEAKDKTAPQVTNVNIPSQFHVGVKFTATLTSDFDNPDSVEKAIIYIKGATKHIVVSKKLFKKAGIQTMEITGLLNNIKDLTSNDFTLMFAMQTSDSITGAYKSSAMKISEEKASCEEDDPCCNGGSVIQEGMSCTKDIDNLSCTVDTCDADAKCVAKLADGFCLIDGNCVDSQWKNPDNSCEVCNSTSKNDAWSPVENGTACVIGEFMTPGTCTEGKCIETVVDGDMDAELEPELEPEAESGIEVEPEPELEPETESFVEVEPEPELEPEPEPELEPEAEIDLDGFVLPPGFCDNNVCWDLPPTGQTGCYVDDSTSDCSAMGGTPPSCDQFISCYTTIDGDEEVTETTEDVETTRSSRAPSECYCGQDPQYLPSAKSLSIVSLGGDAGVQDSISGLLWQANIPSTYEGCGSPAEAECAWQDAVDYCLKLSYGGFADWRLPNPHELQTIVDSSKSNPAIDTNTFFFVTAVWFWTISEGETGSGQAWGVDFYGGNVGKGAKTDKKKVICVRGAY